MTYPLQGVIEILRGVTPAEVLDIGRALVDGGIRVIEVPLNSPQPFDNIARLVREFGTEALIGAGTVLAPNFDAVVVQRSKARGVLSMPGVATPSEGIAALAAGADALKLVPAELIGAPVMKA